MPATPAIHWTNQSVKAFAKGSDPLRAIEAAARSLVLKARETGWEGPPFNPLRIAELLKVKVEANSSIADARLIATNAGPKIEYNPQQPRERVRFSIAHEIAHLLFPDWQERIRNRGGDKASPDDWQLEMLCNLAASEFVLPIGSLSIASAVPSMEDLMRQCRDYDVSVEAFLIRLAKISNQPIGVLFASSADSSDASRRYAIDYYVGSPFAPRVALKSAAVPPHSVIRNCTAIGYTDHSVESWIVDSPTLIECVGIPGYPGSMFPRVAGLVRFRQSAGGSKANTGGSRKYS